MHNYLLLYLKNCYVLDKNIYLFVIYLFVKIIKYNNLCRIERVTVKLNVISYNYKFFSLKK